MSILGSSIIDNLRSILAQFQPEIELVNHKEVDVELPVTEECTSEMEAHLQQMRKGELNGEY